MKLDTTARNAACDAVVDLVDIGGPGILRFETSAGTPVATLTFSAPAFGPAVNGSATANPIAPDTNAAGGTISRASVLSGTARRWENTVGTSGAEINLSTLTIPAGATVTVSSYSVTMPAK